MITKKSTDPEKFQTYRRWEMDALDRLEEAEEPELTDSQQIAKESQAVEASPMEAESETQTEELIQVAMPTAEEVAAIRQSAQEEGYAAGYSEGYAQGHAAGYSEGRKVAEIEIKSEVAQLQMVLTKLREDLHDVDQQVADQLLELAVALARKIVTQSLKLKPELILPIVQEAIRNLPNAMQQPRLYLHPEDARLVITHLSEQMVQENWGIREDEQLMRGGCRIEANGCEINGSMEVRWQKVLSMIGQTDILA